MITFQTLPHLYRSRIFDHDILLGGNTQKCWIYQLHWLNRNFFRTYFLFYLFGFWICVEWFFLVEGVFQNYDRSVVNILFVEFLFGLCLWSKNILSDYLEGFLELCFFNHRHHDWNWRMVSFFGSSQSQIIMKIKHIMKFKFHRKKNNLIEIYSFIYKSFLYNGV